MNFEGLSIANFLTIGNASLDLDDRGLILIQGENLDDTSANSNGSGKSSIVDAFCWVLFGETARGVSGDAVVNRTTKKDCRVATSILDDDGSRYQIERFRKDAKEKNALLVHKTAKDGTHTTMTKGTDRETQEVVNGILGCSKEVFVAAIYAGQEQMPDLPGMTDKLLKVLIEEAAGISVLEQAHVIAKKKAGVAKEVTATMTRALDQITIQEANLNAQIVDSMARSTDFDATKRDRAKAKLSEVLTVQKEIVALGVDEATQETKLLELRASIDVEKGELAAIKVAELEVNEASMHSLTQKHALDSATKDMDNKRKVLTTLVAEIKNLEALIGTPCGECGKEYCAHDLEAAKNARLTKAKELKAEYETSISHRATCNAAADKAEIDWTALKAKVKNPTLISNSIQAKEDAFAAMKADAIRVKNLAHEIANIKTAANDILKEDNPFADLIEKQNKALTELLAKKTQAFHNKDKAEVAESIAADAVKVFGPSGVRAHILDTVTPFLNDRTRDYLGALSDGNIHATWSTLTKSAKGELKEKFSIAVTNDFGSETFAGLSGGEKRKVRLATALALQDLVASRATKPLRIFIGDEIDEALDASGLERLVGVLERKARDKGTVFIISHHDLADWIDSVIYVKKEAGISSITGDTHKVT